MKEGYLFLLVLLLFYELFLQFLEFKLCAYKKVSKRHSKNLLVRAISNPLPFQTEVQHEQSVDST